MKKVVTLGMIAVLLYSVCFSAVAVAQKDAIDDSPAGIDKKTAQVENAINDYLSGKVDTLSVAGVKPGSDAVSEGHAPAGYTCIMPPEMSGDLSAAAGEFSVMMATAGETLPYTVGTSSNYAATYIGACGAYSRTPSVRASSVYTRVNAGSFKNMQNGEILVLHLWGKASSGAWHENDIVIGKNQANPAYVDFTLYVSAFANPWVKTITLPASHSFTMYIKTVYPSGIYYKQLEFSVYDITTLRSYTYRYTLPAWQVMDSADIALEKVYQSGEPRPGLVLRWRSVTQFRVYNQYNRLVNLLQSGFVTEWATPGVKTAYYHDYNYYAGIANSLGTFYMTRYAPWMPYPLRPAGSG